ncbi:MAG: hypothetical protein ACI4LO_05040 [Anaerovoracaceae bacterium]
MCTRCQAKAATALFSASIKHEQNETEILRMLKEFDENFSYRIGSGWYKEVLELLSGFEPASTVLKQYINSK